MFQRLKGAIDSRIAEEQARQRQASLTAQQSSTRGTRRQNGVPARQPSQQRENEDAQSAEKGPDPAEFEPEFAIGEDESAVPSRVGTPLPEVKEWPEAGEKEKEKERQKETDRGDGEAQLQEQEQESPEGDKVENGNGVAAPAFSAKPAELPTEVRVKLRKLDRLEGRYQELLKAYRTAHARIQLIEPFEAALRENTPLTSISDPGALVEYLNQSNLKSDMVLDELKRVSVDRDDYKKKFEESEKSTTELRSEVVELKAKVTSNGEVKEAAARPSLDVKAVAPAAINTGEAPAAAKSPTSPASSRVPSFSLFSPKSKAKSLPMKETSEEFFSYDSEVPRLETELQARQTEVETLQKQLESVKGDLAVARESTESMVQSLESATRELHGLRDAKDKFDSTKQEMQGKIDELQVKVDENSSVCDELRKQIQELQTEKEKALQGAQAVEDRAVKSDEEANERIAKSEKIAETLNERLAQKDATVKDLEDTLAMYKSAERQATQRAEEETSSEKRIATMQNIMESLKVQLKSAETMVEDLKRDITAKQDEFSKRASTKVFGFLDDQSDPALNALENQEAAVRYLADKFNLREPNAASVDTEEPTAIVPQAEAAGAGAGAGKKKNKKKRKGKAGQVSTDGPEHDVPVKVTEDLADADDETRSIPVISGPGSEELLKEMTNLREQIESRNATIDRLSTQIKDQEALQEEIETLRDDLLHQGEEHVEARDALKELQTQKKALEETVAKLEKDLVDTQKKLSTGSDSEKAHSDLLTHFEELKTRSRTLQTDLAAAEQLAAARFKDITDLRELLSKAQPELRNLRSEVAELKSTKEDLKNRTGELNRLESRHEDLKAEMKGLGKRLGDKDTEIKELNQKIEQETSSRSRAEDDLRVAQSDLRYSEARKQESIESAAQTSKDIAKAKEETLSLKGRLSDLDEQLSTHSKQVSDLREELALKAALHTSSQSLVQSLRDQTHELSTQARESGTRAESLEEELGEAQRMLLERTRDSQTMRMLLSQAETGTETRIREMKERMESAIEERDRVEDEASVASRRMVREVEEAKGKARDAARQVKLLEDDKEEVETRLREMKRRFVEVEATTESSTREAGEVRSAMDRLREALDESERQVGELEGQRSGLRKELEEARERVEKLVRSNKALSEEMKGLGQRKASVRPGVESGVQSSRSSFDSAGGGAGLRSPTPRERVMSPTAAVAARSETPTGPNTAGVDYVYLKNVLLQFLEQKDKNHQKQLVPVLGMLLHFDRKDEQKWMAAITAR